MTTLDGQDVFSTGPNELVPGGQTRETVRRSFPGIDGELVLDFGLRPQRVTQTGRLQADSASELYAQIAQIEELIDGAAHRLVDNHGQTFQKVLIESFRLTSPIRKARGFWCEYEIEYRQLP